MTASALDDLAFLTQALRGHVEWLQEGGAFGVPACDEAWLEQRREHYRRTALLDDRAPAAEDRAPAAEDSPLAPTDSSVAPPAREPRPQSVPTRQAPAASLAPERSDAVAGAKPADAASHPLREATSVAKAAPPPAPGASTREAAALWSPPAIVSTERAVASPRPEAKVEVPLPATPEERRHQLTLLEEQVRSCRACGLCEQRTNTVFARGNGSVGVAFVGEGPGADEDAQGYPFVGAAGQLLDKMIGAMGLNREDVYVCNIIKCRPPKNRKPTDDEIAACRHFAVSQLELVQPRVIVALGATAVEGLLGLKLGITRLRGTWRVYKGTIPVMPTFHPAYLLREPEAKRLVWEDLQAVLGRLNMPVPQRRR